MTSDKKNTKTTTCLTPKLILKPTSNKPNTETSLFFPSAPIATGVFILPIKHHNHNNNHHHRRGRHPSKHLRKPPSFDSYLHSSTITNTTTTHCGFMTRTTRTPSLSSSYSSTSSLVDNVPEFTNEEMMYGYGSQKSIPLPHRHHRRLSSGYRVRFAEASDDGSSIVSSSSADDWDDMDIDEEEEDYIFVTPQPPPQHYST